MLAKLYNDTDRCPNHPDRKMIVKGMCKSCYNIKQFGRTKLCQTVRKSRYGITEEEFQSKRISQNNKCAICNKEFLKPCVDHDHVTGKFRGLLCQICNRGIGHFKDNVVLLAAAIVYLESYENKK